MLVADFLGPVLPYSVIQCHMLRSKDAEPLLTQVHQPYVTCVTSLVHLLTSWRLIKIFAYCDRDQGTPQSLTQNDIIIHLPMEKDLR